MSRGPIMTRGRSVDSNPFGPSTGETTEAPSQLQETDGESDENQRILVATPAAPRPSRFQAAPRPLSKITKKKGTNVELLQAILATVYGLRNGRTALLQELAGIKAE